MRLSGVIQNTSSDMYYGAAAIGLLTSGAKYEFMQLNRDLEGPGTLSKGSFDFAFFFKNVDLECDSYFGISLDVYFQVRAELVYQGNVMNYTVEDTKRVLVRNYTSRQQRQIKVQAQPKVNMFAKKEEEDKDASDSDEEATTSSAATKKDEKKKTEEKKESNEPKSSVAIREPSLKIEYSAFRDLHRPCHLQLYLH